MHSTWSELRQRSSAWLTVKQSKLILNLALSGANHVLAELHWNHCNCNLTFLFCFSVVLTKESILWFLSFLKIAVGTAHNAQWTNFRHLCRAKCTLAQFTANIKESQAGKRNACQTCKWRINMHLEHLHLIHRIIVTYTNKANLVVWTHWAWAYCLRVCHQSHHSYIFSPNNFLFFLFSYNRLY